MNPARIMVFGTFDILHKGHLDFFKQARNLAANPYLIVSVARDRNVKNIKGRIPVFNQAARVQTLRRVSLVDKVVLAGLNKHIPHIVKEAPRIIALGYDQKAYVKNLKSSLKQKGLAVKIVRLKAFKPQIYKSSLSRSQILRRVGEKPVFML